MPFTIESITVQNPVDYPRIRARFPPIEQAGRRSRRERFLARTSRRIGIQPVVVSRDQVAFVPPCKQQAGIKPVI